MAKLIIVLALVACISLSVLAEENAVNEMNVGSGQSGFGLERMLKAVKETNQRENQAVDTNVEDNDEVGAADDENDVDDTVTNDDAANDGDISNQEDNVEDTVIDDSSSSE